ncbi:hypothetical protein [Lyngbya sp. CCY1209]|uniref:hypothetical protein n=1 Tax=Lyngbya sp. CCY1209 TaxID=2886103 RepID=UPI002D210FD5|nr:hypothetical protein [Lyngbya sp. CCY1209]MEB3882828.1 hypothetical protein [Lyngbya sp. CCY1209]
MTENYIPSDSVLYIQDFLTYLEQAKTNSDTNLATLQPKLAAAEDRPPQLAAAIKSWCKDHNIKLDRTQLAAVRANMLNKGETPPRPAEGERPETIYNKALLVEKVRQATEEQSEK